MLDRYRRKIVGYDISYDKNPETIQKIIDTSPKANQYYSDGYTGYFNLNYHGGSYKSFNNKSQTHNIESVNSDFRKYIPCLQRKSKCFSRSLELLKVIFTVFVHVYNKFSINCVVSIFVERPYVFYSIVICMEGDKKDFHFIKYQNYFITLQF